MLDCGVVDTLVTISCDKPLCSFQILWKKLMTFPVFVKFLHVRYKSLRLNLISHSIIHVKKHEILHKYVKDIMGGSGSSTTLLYKKLKI